MYSSNLQVFLKQYQIDFSNCRIKVEDIPIFEEHLGTKFCQQLKNYLLEYGYIGYKSFEMLGINRKQYFESDMVKETLAFYELCPEYKGKAVVVFKNDKDDFYILEEDNHIVRVITGGNAGVLISTHLTLEGFIEFELGCCVSLKTGERQERLFNIMID